MDLQSLSSAPLDSMRWGRQRGWLGESSGQSRSFTPGFVCQTPLFSWTLKSSCCAVFCLKFTRPRWQGWAGRRAEDGGRRYERLLLNVVGNPCGLTPADLIYTQRTHWAKHFTQHCCSHLCSESVYWATGRCWWDSPSSGQCSTV